MTHLKQFIIIMAVTCAGETLHFLLPLPVPASIYGLILMFVLLLTKVLHLEDTEGAGSFLIEIMPVMFIPAGVGLLTSWEHLRPILFPVSVITVLSTFIVMAVTGIVTDRLVKKNRRWKALMNEWMIHSATAGVVLSLASYSFGLWLRKKTGFAWVNPLLVSIILCILMLKICRIDYESYQVAQNMSVTCSLRQQLRLPSLFTNSFRFSKTTLLQSL